MHTFVIYNLQEFLNGSVWFINATSIDIQFRYARVK